MKPTQSAVEMFTKQGWTPAQLEAQGYVKDGEPTEAILEALRASSWTDEMMVEHGMATTDEPPKADTKVRRYIDLRDEQDRMKKALKERIQPITEEMSTLERELADILHSQGQSKMGSDAGTFFFTDKLYVKTEDYEQFQRFLVNLILNRLVAKGFLAEGKTQYDAVEACMDSLAFNFLTQAVRKEAVQEYLKENGTPPPGLATETAQEVQVRRK